MNYQEEKDSTLTVIERELMEATENWDVSAIRDCLSRGANVNCTINKEKAIKAADLLLANGADINLYAKYSEPPLLRAIYDSDEVVKQGSWHPEHDYSNELVLFNNRKPYRITL